MFNDLNILDENWAGMEAQKLIGTFQVRVWPLSFANVLLCIWLKM